MGIKSFFSGLFGGGSRRNEEGLGSYPDSPRQVAQKAAARPGKKRKKKKAVAKKGPKSVGGGPKRKSAKKVTGTITEGGTRQARKASTGRRPKAAPPAGRPSARRVVSSRPGRRTKAGKVRRGRGGYLDLDDVVEDVVEAVEEATDRSSYDSSPSYGSSSDDSYSSSGGGYSGGGYSGGYDSGGGGDYGGGGSDD